MATRRITWRSRASAERRAIVNGTTETVFLTVTVTKPSAVTATQSFAIRNATTVAASSSNCYTTSTLAGRPSKARFPKRLAI